MLRCIHVVHRHFREGHTLGWIKHAETNARNKKPLHGLVNPAFGNYSFVDSLHERLVLFTARQVGARFDGSSSGPCHIGPIMVAFKDVANRTAVAYYKAVKSPIPAQSIFEQHVAGTGGHTIDTVVSAHDGIRLRFFYRRFEG